jgi:hypothetical protein
MTDGEAMSWVISYSGLKKWGRNNWLIHMKLEIE